MLKEKGILFDVTMCAGCGACYEACKKENGLPETGDDFLKDHLSASTYTVVEEYGDKYARKMCMHCIDPACVSVCLVGAFTKTETGAVLYDADKCIGCRYCMQACPHMIPRYEWSETKPKVKKCNMCYNRVKKGGIPACAEACPSGATIFGDFEDMKAEAQKRIKENPSDYYPHIYGLEEAGGSHVLILSPVPFDKLGYTSGLTKVPMPEHTQKAMDNIPPVVGAAGLFLGGMYWLTKRKNQIAREELHESNRGNNDESR
jgi:formate dehydrogenase iron-sulfur subunit